MRPLLAWMLLVVASACRRSDSESETSALVQVKTATVNIAPFADIVSAIGTVSARAGHIASLSAPAPARIAVVYVSQGQKVAAGTALVAFEQAPFVAARQSAEAALTAAERNYDRARRLAEAGILLRAPISGIVTRLNAPLGASVDVNQPIVEVADLSALDIIFNVSPSDAARIAPGASVTLSAGESAKGEPLGVGRIIDVGGTVDSATRSVAVRAQAPPTARPLRIGETIFGQISTGVHPRAIVIPVAALVPDGEGYKVFVVTPGNVARARKVTVGRRSESTAEILSGLAQGEQVVTEGAYGLEDSVKVVQAK